MRDVTTVEGVEDITVELMGAEITLDETEIAEETKMPPRVDDKLEDWQVYELNWGRYIRNHGKRTCAHEGCGTVLRYTRADGEDLCSIHE